MKLVLTLIIGFCLIVTASGAWEIQHVGGEFGRAWLSNYEAQKNENKTKEDEANLSSQNRTQMSNTSLNNGSLVKDWLGETSIQDPYSQHNNSTNASAKMMPLAASKIFHPIHEMDASFHQTLPTSQLPQPDENGLIHGLPAETYYAIGQGFFDA